MRRRARREATAAGPRQARERWRLAAAGPRTARAASAQRTRPDPARPTAALRRLAPGLPSTHLEVSAQARRCVEHAKGGATRRLAARSQCFAATPLGPLWLDRETRSARDP